MVGAAAAWASASVTRYSELVTSTQEISGPGFISVGTGIVVGNRVL
jgi:hypothetical protein